MPPVREDRLEKLLFGGQLDQEKNLLCDKLRKINAINDI
jgi:hypothetical protein